MDEQACKGCKYWKEWSWQDKETIKRGFCRRYPQHAVKDENDWCGEWTGPYTGKA